MDTGTQFSLPLVDELSASKKLEPDPIVLTKKSELIHAMPNL